MTVQHSIAFISLNTDTHYDETSNLVDSVVNFSEVLQNCLVAKSLTTMMVGKSLAEVNENINFGYSQDQGYS